MKLTQSTAQEVVSQRSLALVGVSRNPRNFGNAILRELKGKGYKVFPVHPQAQSIEGERCYPNLASLPDKVGALVICVRPAQADQVLRQAADVGIKRVWMQQGSGSEAARKFCEEHEMIAVHGQCILMFAEPVTSIHGFHRWIWRLIGKYPSASHH